MSNELEAKTVLGRESDRNIERSRQGLVGTVDIDDKLDAAALCRSFICTESVLFPCGVYGKQRPLLFAVQIALTGDRRVTVNSLSTSMNKNEKEYYHRRCYCPPHPAYSQG